MFRALRVRKKMSGEKMPVKMIGDILTAQLPHMQPYIRFCSCQLNGAALIQQKTDEVPEFKEFVKVRKDTITINFVHSKFSTSFCCFAKQSQIVLCVGLE